jgi:hypothetical protein
MYPLVFGERRVFRKGFGTHGTTVGLFSRMYALVFHQAVVAAEGLAAYFAFVRFLP